MIELFSDSRSFTTAFGHLLDDSFLVKVERSERTALYEGEVDRVYCPFDTTHYYQVESGCILTNQRKTFIFAYRRILSNSYSLRVMRSLDEVPLVLELKFLLESLDVERDTYQPRPKVVAKFKRMSCSF